MLRRTTDSGNKLCKRMITCLVTDFVFFLLLIIFDRFGKLQIETL